MTELVHLEVGDGVATITLDSQPNRNALGTQLVSEVRAHLVAASADTDVRCVLIRSAGSVFCSGADLSEAVFGDGMLDRARSLIALQRQIVTSPKPVVVELAGAVRAGGLGIVGAADIVIAAESVTFQLTEVRLGLAAAVISATLIPRFTDRAASDLFLTARKFGALKAARVGLITRAVPDDSLGAEIDLVLRELAKGYPQGLRESKLILNRDVVARIDELGESLAAKSVELFESEEARAAMSAFLGKPK